MKKKNRKTLIAMAIVCFAFVSSVNAQSRDREQKEPPTYAELLEKMDENEDGKLEESELKGPLKEHFSEIDSNEDGYISEKEFENAPKPKGKRPQRD